MAGSERVREARLRRMAVRQGLTLRKSSRRDPLATDFGKYILHRAEDGQPVFGAAANNLPGATLDEIEAYLTRRPR